MAVLCMIIPLSEMGNVPAHPIAPGGPPPGIWPSPGHPAHPIAPGGQPPGIWGGAPSYPDQGLPGQPPGIWPSPGHPAHPIAPGGPPPGIWPSPGHPAHPIAPGGRPPGIWGGAPSYPDQGLPGPQPIPTPPIYLPPGTIPGHPEHPIYIPPSIWPSPGVPTHPIVLPPAGSGEKPEVLENWEVKTAWSATTGWVVAIVPTEEHPGTPTPSR
ncbi:MAG TPA: hypothetical protein VFB89_00465 [Gemmatimonadales bacterium]|nr:hypothetical protein [Gemmatimonadales bacterium]